MTKGSALVGFILSFIAGMGLMWGVSRGARQGSIDAANDEVAMEGGRFSDDGAAVPLSSKDAVWGARSAPVTIVEFSDFGCGFSRRVQDTLSKLRAKYGNKRLRLAWKHFPLPMHPKAKATHEAAEAVFRAGGAEAFFKFRDLAFANPREQTPENFAAWASQAGVDVQKFNELRASPEVKAKVAADTALGRKLGVRGTPAFYVNGVFLSGAQPIQRFTAEIDRQLTAAKQLRAKGTPADQVYVKLTNANHARGSSAARDKKRPKQDDKTVWKIPVTDGDPQKGPDTALVTIVEFSEFQCPFCKRVLATEKKIYETYGDKIRHVWKDNPLPFHKHAEPAALLAREARAQQGDEGFWKAHDLLFDNSKKLADDDLWDYAVKLELDVDRVKQAVGEGRHRAAIEAGLLLADDFNASGTPHFFINGRRLVGAQPFDRFQTIIDEEIKKAEALLANGTKPKDLYATLTKDGKDPPPPLKKDVDPPHKNAPWRGGAKAKVVIQQFSEFQCGSSKQMVPTVEKLQQEYGNRVKWVWRHLPRHMHKHAPLAAEAAQEAWAQQGKKGFWAYYDKLFGPQQSLERDGLEKAAAELSLDIAQFGKALDEHRHQEIVELDRAAAKKAGISSTPTFVINGYLLRGAQPAAKLRRLIDRATREAK